MFMEKIVLRATSSFKARALDQPCRSGLRLRISTLATLVAKDAHPPQLVIGPKEEPYVGVQRVRICWGAEANLCPNRDLQFLLSPVCACCDRAPASPPDALPNSGLLPASSPDGSHYGQSLQRPVL